MSFIQFALIAVLLIAVLTDLSQRKIPNLLTFPAMLAGLAGNTVLGGLDGFLFSGAGLLAGLATLILFYAFGMMGAGDVKLMGAVGSFLGAAGVLQAFLFTALAGGVYAVFALARKRQLGAFLRRCARSAWLTLSLRKPTWLPGEEADPPVLCYGVAIAVGTVASMYLHV